MTAITMLAADQLKPNDYNPNSMSPEGFAELVAEVRHLGRVPKPIIVRPNGSGYVIVDGEHGWRAAGEVGLAKVPCEVIAVDDFEARRQTFKRNQHGEHCPLRLGRMFRQMMAQRGLSQRALAKEIEVSEGTIRNVLAYADAADMRNSYAPENADTVMSKLRIRQVRTYVDLPKGIRDPWLDDGADIDRLWTLGQCTDKGQKFCVERPEEWEVLIDANLHHPLARYSFDYAHDLWLLWHWRNNILRHAPWVDAYIGPMIDHGLKAPTVKRLIPVSRDDSGAWQPLVSPERWIEIIADAAARSEKAGVSIEDIVHAHVRPDLREQGIDYDYSDPRVIEAVEAIEAGPDYLKDADIALTDKLAILRAEADVDVDTLDEAKRQAVKTMKAKEEALTKLASGEISRDPQVVGHLAAKWVETTAESAVKSALQRILLDQKYLSREALFADRAALTDQVMEIMRSQFVLRDGKADGAPVHKIMRDRLDALPHPELNLIAAYILGEGQAATSLWAQALGVSINARGKAA